MASLNSCQTVNYDKRFETKKIHEWWEMENDSQNISTLKFNRMRSDQQHQLPYQKQFIFFNGSVDFKRHQRKNYRSKSDFKRINSQISHFLMLPDHTKTLWDWKPFDQSTWNEVRRPKQVIPELCYSKPIKQIESICLHLLWANSLSNWILEHPIGSSWCIQDSWVNKSIKDGDVDNFCQSSQEPCSFGHKEMEWCGKRNEQQMAWVLELGWN